MIRNLEGSQFKTRGGGIYPFHAENKNPEPKTVQLWFDSQDKMSGTNNNASFQVELPTEFMSERLKVTLRNFIPMYPTNTNEGIICVNLNGLNNPYSYSSSNQNTHQTLGTFSIGAGFTSPKEYPPAALSQSGLTTSLSNQAYGNGNYVLGQSSSYSSGHVWRAFARDNGTTFAGTNFGAGFAYNNATGF